MTAAVPVCGVCGAVHRGGGCLVLGRHLDDLRAAGHTPASIYARKRAILRAADAAGVPLADATTRDLLGWLMRLNVTPGTRRGYTAHLRRFMAFMVADGMRPDDPAASLPTPPKTRGLPRPIGEDDLMLAVEVAPRRIRPWLVLAGWCGLRAREIAYLRRESVAETGLPPVLLVTREAAKGGRFERAVPLPPFVLSDMRSWQMPRSGFVFTRRDGRPGPNAPHVISHLCNCFLHDCGIAATLHSCRHRYATGIYRQRRDLLAVSALLGHRDLDSTAVYAQYDTAAAAADAAALPTPDDDREETGE
jgi:integrase/recombinase XerC